MGAVEIKGNKLFSTEDILKGFVLEGKLKKPEMTVGKTFTPKGLDQDLEAIRDFYGAKGYIDTWVKPIKNPNTEKGTMDLVYEIQDESKGKSFIEKIEIKGNTKTKDKVIRRELAVAPGEVFDMVRVKLSKGRLEQMNYFDKVETETDPTDVPNRKTWSLMSKKAPRATWSWARASVPSTACLGLSAIVKAISTCSIPLFPRRRPETSHRNNHWPPAQGLSTIFCRTVVPEPKARFGRRFVPQRIEFLKRLV